VTLIQNRTQAVPGVINKESEWRNAPNVMEKCAQAVDLRNCVSAFRLPKSKSASGIGAVKTFNVRIASSKNITSQGTKLLTLGQRMDIPKAGRNPGIRNKTYAAGGRQEIPSAALYFFALASQANSANSYNSMTVG